MGAQALNLLVVLSAHVPAEVLGDEIRTKLGVEPHTGHRGSGDDGCGFDVDVCHLPSPARWPGSDVSIGFGSPHGGSRGLGNGMRNGLGAAGRSPSPAPDMPGLHAPAVTNGGSSGSTSVPKSHDRILSQVKELFGSPPPSDNELFGGLPPSEERGSPPDEDQCTCPGMVMVPRSIVDLEVHGGAKDAAADPVEPSVGKVVLVMSRDNIAALAVIAALSILGTIYLWKICTRRHCVCRICRNQYRTLHLLGSGGYGSVYLVERLNDDQRFVSKKILVNEITEVDEYSREAKELVMLRHRHIVSYEDDFVHVEYGALEPKTYFIIIMEYCPEGDLKEKIETDFDSFTEHWIISIFAQLLQAVQYLHSKNVIHRDLKSQNVFLADDGHVRLGDFGLCRRTPKIQGSATLTHAGTDCYMAPEMLSSSRYGKPADIWSLGCVLYELCTGQFMWEMDGILGAMVMKDPHAAHKLIKENLITPCIGGAVAALLRRLLHASPAARPTATSCMRKKLFKRGFPLSRKPFGDTVERSPADEQGSECGSTSAQWDDSPLSPSPPPPQESGADEDSSAPPPEGFGAECSEDDESTSGGEGVAGLIGPTRSDAGQMRRRRQHRRRLGRR